MFLSVGAAYFVFSETLDVYSGKDKRFKRFQDAAIRFIGSLEMIIRSAPLYKLFPTKPYRQYLQKVNAVQDIGKSHVQTMEVASYPKRWNATNKVFLTTNEVFLTVCRGVSTLVSPYRRPIWLHSWHLYWLFAGCMKLVVHT